MSTGTARDHTAREQAPRDVDVVAALPATGPMLVRAALTSFGKPGAGAGLPSRTVLLPELEQDTGRLARYARVCGFTLRDHVPPTWLHVLTFPLQTQLLTSRDFPFAAAGMVHVANWMTLHRPVAVGETLGLAVHVDHLRAHRAGVALDFVEEVTVGEETVWEGVSTYLVKGARMPGDDGPPEAASGSESGAPSDGPVSDGTTSDDTTSDDTTSDGTTSGVTPPDGAPLGGTTAPPRASSRWRLPGGLGREYASVSGDLNPIHLNPWAAKAFGFPRTIAHGMWTHARALAALDGRLPEAYTTTVEFRKPVLLPSTVSFGARVPGQGQGWEFAVTGEDGERVHLLGTVDSAR